MINFTLYKQSRFKKTLLTQLHHAIFANNVSLEMKLQKHFILAMFLASFLFAISAFVSPSFAQSCQQRFALSGQVIPPGSYSTEESCLAKAQVCCIAGEEHRGMSSNQCSQEGGLVGSCLSDSVSQDKLPNGFFCYSDSVCRSDSCIHNTCRAADEDPEENDDSLQPSWPQFCPIILNEEEIEIPVGESRCIFEGMSASCVALPDTNPRIQNIFCSDGTVCSETLGGKCVSLAAAEVAESRGQLPPFCEFSGVKYEVGQKFCINSSTTATCESYGSYQSSAKTCASDEQCEQGICRKTVSTQVLIQSNTAETFPQNTDDETHAIQSSSTQNIAIGGCDFGLPFRACDSGKEGVICRRTTASLIGSCGGSQIQVDQQAAEEFAELTGDDGQYPVEEANCGFVGFGYDGDCPSTCNRAGQSPSLLGFCGGVLGSQNSSSSQEDSSDQAAEGETITRLRRVRVIPPESDNKTIVRNRAGMLVEAADVIPTSIPLTETDGSGWEWGQIRQVLLLLESTGEIDNLDYDRLELGYCWEGTSENCQYNDPNVWSQNDELKAFAIDICAAIQADSTLAAGCHDVALLLSSPNSYGQLLSNAETWNEAYELTSFEDFSTAAIIEDREVMVSLTESIFNLYQHNRARSQPMGNTEVVSQGQSQSVNYLIRQGDQYSQLDYDGVEVCNGVDLGYAGCGVFVTAQLLGSDPLQTANLFCTNQSLEFLEEVGETATISNNGTSIESIQRVLYEQGLEVGEAQRDVSLNYGVEYAVHELENYTSSGNLVVVTIDHVVCESEQCRIIGHQIIVNGIINDQNETYLSAVDSIYDGDWRVCDRTSFDLNTLSPEDEGCAVVKHILPVRHVL